MKAYFPFLLLIFLLTASMAEAQTLEWKDSQICLNAKNKKPQCFDLKKNSIGMEYIKGAFHLFKLPGKPIPTPPKEVFQSKSHFLMSPKYTLDLEKNYFLVNDWNGKVVFKRPFYPGTRGVFIYGAGGALALLTEDCLELEPIEIVAGSMIYNGGEVESGLIFTLSEDDQNEISSRIICKLGIGIICIEDNIIDPRLQRIDLDDVFNLDLPEELLSLGMDPPGTNPPGQLSEGGSICKECETLDGEEDWHTVCEIDLGKKGIYKACGGQLVVKDKETGEICMQLDLSQCPVKVEAIEGNIASLSLRSSCLEVQRSCCGN